MEPCRALHSLNRDGYGSNTRTELYTWTSVVWHGVVWFGSASQGLHGLVRAWRASAD